ncbi:hypothetical protein DSL72_000550 [Monilinia vaccinii-corymbosi]|uniref:Uncharacterized protein n=1 Tax=Monilinia vaccinii-corymbosi TaxID=61207 RepID=A0A8A3P9M3_9HELO|nr:hypothetical protein DSL72_000550 [Monilinia vaccinii-corymbosi]
MCFATNFQRQSGTALFLDICADLYTKFACLPAILPSGCSDLMDSISARLQLRRSFVRVVRDIEGLSAPSLTYFILSVRSIAGACGGSVIRGIKKVAEKSTLSARKTYDDLGDDFNSGSDGDRTALQPKQRLIRTPIQRAQITLIMEALPTALVLCRSASTLRVKCPFCLGSHGHGVGQLPREMQRRCADCHNIPGSQSYQILYPDEESDLTVPFGWELDKEESMIYTVIHQGRLCDPLSLRSQPRRLLDEYSSCPDENDQAAAKDVVAIADSLNSIRLSDSEELGKQPPNFDDLWTDLKKDKSFRSNYYFSACCAKDLKQLEALFREYPEGSFANAVDRKGNNGILLAATEDAGLDTVKWLKQKGVSIDQRNYYDRTASMEAALWGHLETV